MADENKKVSKGKVIMVSVLVGLLVGVVVGGIQVLLFEKSNPTITGGIAGAVAAAAAVMLGKKT